MKTRIYAKLKGWFSFTKNLYLPGFEGLSVYETSEYLMDGLRKNSIIDRAYAISYKFILASFPFIIFLFSVIPYIPIENLQTNILNSVLNALPDQISSYLSGFLQDLIVHKKTSVLSIGFLLTVFFASNTMSAILKGFSSSYHLHRIKNKKITMQLWSFLLMLIFTGLMILVAMVFVFGGFLLNHLNDINIINSSVEYWVIWAIQWILIIFLFMLAISILYNLGNTERVKWKLFSPGVIVSTLMIWAFSELFTLYLNSFASYNRLYGSLGTIIVLLLFIYYCFAILLVGFELNMSIESAKKKKMKGSSN